MAGSLNDYEAMTAALGGSGGKDPENSDFKLAEEQKRKARLQVASRIADGKLSMDEGVEVLDMLGLLPGQQDGPSLSPARAFNPSSVGS